jgi:hypothetical protein
MGLPALILAQALVSLAPSLENVRALNHDLRYRGDQLATTAAAPALAPVPPPDVPPQDAITLSDDYYRRLDLHRYAGYAMLPLFFIEYAAGQKLLERGSRAPLWAETVHKPAAYLVAGLFTLNTVTGLWNLAEASKVKQGKQRRTVHSIMMLAADAGFIYGAAVAPSTAKIDQRIASGKRGGWTPHKASTVISMSLATVSYLMMFVWKEGE